MEKKKLLYEVKDGEVYIYSDELLRLVGSEVFAEDLRNASNVHLL